MKRILCLLLPILLLCGCGAGDSQTVSFCYLRQNVEYGDAQGVLVLEERTVSQADAQLETLISLYLRGPQSDELKMPVSQGTRLLETDMVNGILTMTFSSHLTQLEGMDLTLACACIASTVFQITDAQQVQIRTPATADSAPLAISMSRNSLITYDFIPETTASQK